MKVTVFTSNQPRHIALINRLAQVADTVFAVQECNTVFPGQVKDFFNNSDIMRDYFSRVLQSEKNVFGGIAFLERNVRTLSLKSGDLSKLPLDVLDPALESDYFVVFGASYIRSPLVDLLIEKKALNIHMGISPFYRGSSCNFWAMHDGNYDFVGATIHLLDKGLDSGNILCYAFPEPAEYEAFDLGMYAVKAAQESLVNKIREGIILEIPDRPQNRESEIRYTRNSDFTDEIASQYLENLPTPINIKAKLECRHIH